MARERTAAGAAAALALAGLALGACAGGPVEPEVDLRPWDWTWSQASLGSNLVRYGYPDTEPAAQTPDGASAAVEVLVDGRRLADGAPPRPEVEPGVAVETHFASYRYGCAREDRAQDAPCTVILDFWLLALEPPLAGTSLPAYRERFERVYADPPAGLKPANADPVVRGFTRDTHGRDWYHLGLAFASGASFDHFSRPIDVRRAVAVTSFTTRAPDRVAARQLARDAIDRVVAEPQR